jgi:hypothetical protein
MKRKNNKFQIAKKGFVFAMAVSTLAFASCEKQAVEPKKPNNVVAMDPPKDTTPVKPPQ